MKRAEYKRDGDETGNEARQYQAQDNAGRFSMTEDDLKNFREMLQRSGANRRHDNAGRLTICLDGKIVAEYDPKGTPLALSVADAGLLEVYGQMAQGECLLATFPLYDIEDGDVFQGRLEGGQQVRLKVLHRSETDEALGFRLQFSYRDGWLKRFLGSHSGLMPWQLPTWMPVFRPQWVMGLLMIIFLSMISMGPILTDYSAASEDTARLPIGQKARCPDILCDSGLSLH